MKNKILLVLLFLSVSLFAAYAKPDYNNWKLSLNCLGPICVGMSIEQASKIIKLEPVFDETVVSDEGSISTFKTYQEAIKLPNHCFHISFENPHLKNVGFMITNKHISRIEIDGESIKTLSGIGIGDSEEKVKKVYKGKITIEHHVYVEKGHYLIYKPKDKADQKYWLLFETDGKKVISFRSGYAKEVYSCEGCL
jgi:hypothetical protein